MDQQLRQFSKILPSYPEAIQKIALAVREKIYKILPKVVEVVWVRQKTAGYGTGPKKNSEHFCWIQLAKSHVNLGFNYGVEINDPSNLLEGTGKKFRHVKIRKIEDLNSKDIEALIRFATTFKVPPIVD